MNNFDIIYKILRVFELAMDYDAPNEADYSAERFGISKNRWVCLLDMLAKNGYIEGIKVQKTVDGSKIISICNPCITLSGLEYLEENSIMNKACKAVKGIADIIK